MFKTYPKFVVLALVFLSLNFHVISASLSLDKIGALELSGNKYSEWWYTGTKPLFSGKGTPDTIVNIKINEDTYTANTDASGNWSYQTNIDKSDYSVQISQGAENYSFTLHLGQDFPGTSQPSGNTTQETTVSVPNTGFNQISGISMGIGILLLSTYLYIWGDNSKKVAFKKTFIEE